MGVVFCTERGHLVRKLIAFSPLSPKVKYNSGSSKATTVTSQICQITIVLEISKAINNSLFSWLRFL